ncbi:hypothetical protein [Flavobacterium aestivum]|uniref:hypothetical protein n=1 Tax=Flavobacterium aestivum TaxID=3003257 RepID=UPI0022861C97|nr:hypothetical protein [Flavobacterium aestivum]
MNIFYKKAIEAFGKVENKEKFSKQNINPVQYIDLYAGQEQFEENFELFAQNALLIDWDVDHKSSPPMATITLYCCYEQLRDTSNISLNRDLGLKFLDYVATIDGVVRTIESETTGKLELVSEGFHKMDSIVDIYLLTFECSYSGRKNPLDKYQAGDYDTLDLKGKLIIDFD